MKKETNIKYNYLQKSGWQSTPQHKIQIQVKILKNIFLFFCFERFRSTTIVRLQHVFNKLKLGLFKFYILPILKEHRTIPNVLRSESLKCIFFPTENFNNKFRKFVALKFFFLWIDFTSLKVTVCWIIIFSCIEL